MSVKADETGRPILPETGGYVPFAIMDDGETLCRRCVADESNPVHADPNYRDGWCVIGWDHSGNVDSIEPIYCAHCYQEVTQ